MKNHSRRVLFHIVRQITVAQLAYVYGSEVNACRFCQKAVNEIKLALLSLGTAQPT